MAKHYSVNQIKDGEMAFLREVFPEAKADEMNLCFFSTSGIHGDYCTIEHFEKGETDDITFLVVHPRMVSMSYGNVTPKNEDDIKFLKELRKSSSDAASKIGYFGF